MRLGLALPHYDTSLEGAPVSWEGLTRVARVAESARLHSVWLSDHLFLDYAKYGGSDAPQGSLECWTAMSALAATSERIRVGALILCNDFRHPALVAKMAASLDLLSGGRIELGFGAGWYEPEYRAAGIPFDRASRRIERLGEATQIIARLLAGDELTFDGNHYVLRGAICRPPPRQQPRPPVWIGGKGNRLIETAARVGDGWNFSWLGSVETYRERAAHADAACEKHEREPATLRRSVGAYLLVGRDSADLSRRYEILLERTPPGVMPRAGSGAAVSWEEFRKRGVCGTVAEVVDMLGRLGELGVEEVIVTLGALPFQLADETALELLGEVASQLAGDRRTDESLPG